MTTKLIMSFLEPNSQPTNFLVVAPLLTEVERYVTSCPRLDFIDPKPIKGRKSLHIKELIKQRRNICTTHALFSCFDKETIELLKGSNYELILDETIECVNIYSDISKQDFNMLFTAKHIAIEPHTNQLRWLNVCNNNYSGRFYDVKTLCDNNSLVNYNESVFMFVLNVDLFCHFKNVHILTYLFKGHPCIAT